MHQPTFLQAVDDWEQETTNIYFGRSHPSFHPWPALVLAVVGQSIHRDFNRLTESAQQARPGEFGERCLQQRTPMRNMSLLSPHLLANVTA